MNSFLKKISPESKLSFILINVFLSALILLIILSNLNYLWFGCINANDFSIYQQGIYNISLFNEFNPFSTVRDIRILSDHFDPIIYLPALIIRLFGASPYTLFIFEWLHLPLFTLLIYKLGNFNWKTIDWIKVFTIIVFSKVLLAGFLFPIHPTTWSLIPLTFITYFINKDNSKGVIFTSIVLLLYKELYIFMIIGLSSYYLLKKRIPTFLTLFLIGACAYYAVFIYRIELYETTVNYGNSTLKTFLASPVTVMWNSFTNMDWAYKTIIPCLLLINLKKLRNYLPILLFTAPGILIHVLSGRIVHHHFIPLFMPFLILGLLTTKVHYLIPIAFIATGVGRYTKVTKTVTRYKLSNCIMSSEKRKSIKAIQKITKELDPDLNIISSGSIIPQILTPRNKVIQFDNFTLPKDRYDIIIAEKNYAGDPAPMRQEQLDEIINRCKQVNHKTLYEDKYAILMRGEFSQDCIQIQNYFDLKSGYRSKYINKDSVKKN